MIVMYIKTLIILATYIFLSSCATPPVNDSNSQAAAKSTSQIASEAATAPNSVLPPARSPRSDYAKQNTKKLNVEDCFLSIPQNLFSVFDDAKGIIRNKNELRKNIILRDIENGYLELQNETIISKISIALFVKSNGSPLILITGDGGSVQNFYAFELIDKKWKDLSKTFLPRVSFKKISKYYKMKNIKINGVYKTAAELKMVAHSLIRYRLPRYGRNIEVYASHPDRHNETVLYTLNFNGKIFIKKEVQ